MIRPKTQASTIGSQFRISAGSYNGIPFGAVINKDVRKVIEQRSVIADTSAERIQMHL
tara:strand:+ start:134 stop:307 length:174 start_codon:yes stop_codon:yes gene_type:complete